MKCINPEMKKLVNQYQFNLLPNEDRAKVEAHLLECDSCFQELYRLSPALEALEKVPHQLVDAVEPVETIFLRSIQYYKNSVIPAFIRWWQKPAVKILIPATISLLFIVILLLPKQQDYADLAVIEKAPYQTLAFKGPIEISPEQKLFERGMESYQRDDYASAIQELSAYVEQEPKNIYGQFYLGVCLLLQDNTEESIKHFELATRLSQQEDNESFLERSYWYLGNAYLKLGDMKNAQMVFKTVTKLQGKFTEKANEQISKIETFMNNDNEK